jgi:WD40 repeat protein
MNARQPLPMLFILALCLAISGCAATSRQSISATPTTVVALPPTRTATPTIDLPPTLTPTVTPTSLPTRTALPTPDVIAIQARTGRTPLSAANLAQVAPLAVFNHNSDINNLHFSPDSALLAWSEQRYVWPDDAIFVEADKPNQVWDVQAQQAILRFFGDFPPNILFTPDGKRLVYSPGRGEFSLRDLASGEETQLTPTFGFDSFSLSPDGKWLAYASGGSISIMDLSNGKDHRLLRGSDAEEINSLVFSVDGQQLYTAVGETIRSVQLADGAQQTLPVQFDPIFDIDRIVLSPDGDTLAILTYGELFLLNLNDCCQVRSLEGSRAAAFSPDGALLASVFSDNPARTVGIWDVGSGQLLQTLAGHTAGIYALDFSPDGTLLASGAGDGTVWLWGISGQSLDMPSVRIVGAEDSHWLSQGVSPAWLETADKPARYEIAFSGSCEDLATCTYTGNFTYIIRQCNVTVTITDLETQQVVAEQLFSGAGNASTDCPEKRAFVNQTDTYDLNPLRQEFTDWLTATLAP